MDPFYGGRDSGVEVISTDLSFEVTFGSVLKTERIKTVNAICDADKALLESGQCLENRQHNQCTHTERKMFGCPSVVKDQRVLLKKSKREEDMQSMRKKS